MKPVVQWLLAGAVCFGAGIVAGNRILGRSGTGATGSFGSVNSTVPPFSANEGAGLTFGEAIRKYPARILADLARRPFLTLSDDECAALAREIDLTKAENRQLVAAIRSPRLRTQLWQDWLSDHKNSLPPETLTTLVPDYGVVGEEAYEPLMDLFAASGKAKEYLRTPWGAKFSQAYLRTYGPKAATLNEALSLVPDMGRLDRQGLVEDWNAAHPGMDHFDEVLTHASELGLPEDVRGGAAAGIWKNSSPEDRKVLLDKMDSLPGLQKNQALRSMALYLDRDDAGSATQIFSRFTSLQLQVNAAQLWLSESTPEQRQAFLNEAGNGQNRNVLKQMVEELRKHPPDEDSGQ